MGYDIKESVVPTHNSNKKFLIDLLSILKEVNEPVWRELVSGFDEGGLDNPHDDDLSEDDRDFWEKEIWSVIAYAIYSIDKTANERRICKQGV